MFPHLTLFVPVKRFGDWSDVGFFDRIAAVGGFGQKENLFLDIPFDRMVWRISAVESFCSAMAL